MGTIAPKWKTFFLVGAISFSRIRSFQWKLLSFLSVEAIPLRGNHWPLVEPIPLSGNRSFYEIIARS